jgi:hypothetical protein
MRKFKIFNRLAMICGMLAGLAISARANIIITPTFDSTITNDPNAAAIISTINSAINFYETNITTPITVRIQYQEKSSGLGESLTAYGTISYTTFLNALQANSSGDAVDTSALASLVPSTSTNPVDGDTGMNVTTANMKALGLTSYSGIDGTISVNTSITNYGGSYNPIYYSLLAVVEHEMDEVLGLISNLDQSTTGPIFPEDLFRYSAPGVRSYTTSSLATAYLSVDGGVTDVIGLNQTGGGADYGDWVSSGTPHVQDAYGTPGSSPVFGTPERTALDAIGYNFATPEPASFGLIALGVMGIVGLRRRAQ